MNHYVANLIKNAPHSDNHSLKVEEEDGQVFIIMDTASQEKDMTVFLEMFATAMRTAMMANDNKACPALMEFFKDMKSNMNDIFEETDPILNLIIW